MRRGWTVLFLLGLFGTMTGVPGWSAEPRSTPRQDTREDQAILQDLEMVKELEMLDMLTMLQEMEILREMGPSLSPSTPREEGVQ